MGGTMAGDAGLSKHRYGQAPVWRTAQGWPETASSFQAIVPVMLASIGVPLASVADVKRARDLNIRHVAASSTAEPLEVVTVHCLTRPSGPTSSRKPTSPCSPARRAAAG